MEFIEVKGKTVEDALINAAMQFGVASDELVYEVVEKGSSGFLGIGSKPAVIRVRKKFTIEDCIKEFLNKVFEAMNMQVEILISNDEENHS